MSMIIQMAIIIMECQAVTTITTVTVIQLLPIQGPATAMECMEQVTQVQLRIIGMHIMDSMDSRKEVIQPIVALPRIRIGEQLQVMETTIAGTDIQAPEPYLPTTRTLGSVFLNRS